MRFGQKTSSGWRISDGYSPNFHHPYCGFSTQRTEPTLDGKYPPDIERMEASFLDGTGFYLSSHWWQNGADWRFPFHWSLINDARELELDGTGFVQKEFIRPEIGFSTQKNSGEGVVEQVKGPNGYRDHPLLNTFESFFLQEAEMTERRENEMEALKSIFNTDLVDLRYLLYLWYLSYRPG